MTAHSASSYRVLPLAPAQLAHDQPLQLRRRLASSLVDWHTDVVGFDGALLRFHPPFGDAQRERMRLFWEERVAQAAAGRRVIVLAVPAAGAGAGAGADAAAAAAAPAAVAATVVAAADVGGGHGDGGDDEDEDEDGHDDGDEGSNYRRRRHAAGQAQHDDAPLPPPSSSFSSSSSLVLSDIAGVVELGTPDADTGPFRADVEMLMVSPRHRRAGLGKRLMAAVEDVARQRGRTLLLLATTAGSVAEERVYPRLGYTKFGTVPNYGISPVDGHLVDGVYFYKDLNLNHAAPIDARRHVQNGT